MVQQQGETLGGERRPPANELPVVCLLAPLPLGPLLRPPGGPSRIRCRRIEELQEEVPLGPLLALRLVPSLPDPGGVAGLEQAEVEDHLQAVHPHLHGRQSAHHV